MAANISKRRNGDTGLMSRPVTSWVDQLFQDNLNRFFGDDFWTSSQGSHGNVPVNVRETDKSYEMELVAPGLRKEDFKLNVNNDMLTVSFEKKEEQEQENKNEGWLRKEYKMQSFSRSFSLGDSVDVNKIDAKYNDGILRLSLPKKENAQKLSRTIEIK